MIVTTTPLLGADCVVLAGIDSDVTTELGWAETIPAVVAAVRGMTPDADEINRWMAYAPAENSRYTAGLRSLSAAVRSVDSCSII